jgi:hypothetical protein
MKPMARSVAAGTSSSLLDVVCGASGTLLLPSTANTLLAAVEPASTSARSSSLCRGQHMDHGGPRMDELDAELVLSAQVRL